MELNLDDSSQEVQPIIMRLVVHDPAGTALFLLQYDTVTGAIVFRSIDEEQVVDQLIRSKTTLTSEKGIEAFGSFVAGADEQSPYYRHLLSLYLPGADSNFRKYHVTLDHSLESPNLESSLLLATECYAILHAPLQEYLQTNQITVEQYPLLRKFFFRQYQHQPLVNALTAQTGSGAVQTRLSELRAALSQYDDMVTAVDLYFMTISGAIIAHVHFLDKNIADLTLHQMSHSRFNSPGMFTTDGVSTLWFPFTKSRIGKVNRTISTTLNTLSYASSSRDIRQQVQTNIAHKFHDLVEILTDQDSDSSFGLQTNIGFLVCSIAFAGDYQHDTDTILQISHDLVPKMKNYGESILKIVAKQKKFTPIY